MTAPATLDGRPILWSPQPKQAAFLGNPAFEVLGGGSAFGGKSSAILAGLLRQVHHPRYRGLIIRRTFPELRELMDRALLLYGPLGATWNESAKRWTFPSGATIEFGYCEAYRDVMRYQGQEFTVIAWDELTQCADERMWLYLMSRCRSGVAGLKQQMLATSNPGGPGHAWVKRRFVDVCPGDGTLYTDPVAGTTRAFVQFGLRDNAIGTDADPTYERRLLALPETERRQLLDGDWSAGDGMALSELAKHQHIVPAWSDTDWQRVKETTAQWVGYDWGYAHPAVAVWCVKGRSGIIRVRDTLWMRRMRDDQMADRMVDWLPELRHGQIPVYAGGDVFSQPMARTGDITPRTATVFRERGLQVLRAPIQPGSRKRHLAYLRKLLAWKGAGDRGKDAPPLLVFEDTPGNKRLYQQLESLVVDPDDMEDVLKVDATDGEGGDDGYDALRYALAGNISAVVPEAPRVRHEDMAPSISERRAKRDQVSETGPVVMLPPLSISGAWDQETYTEVRA